MSEQLILTTGESDKASQLYQRHAEIVSQREPYADYLDSLADARTRLDEIEDGGLRSKIANRKEAKTLKIKLNNNQAAVDSQEDDTHDYLNKMADQIQNNYNANLREAQKNFNPANQEAFYDTAAEMNAEFVKREAVKALASTLNEQ